MARRQVWWAAIATFADLYTQNVFAQDGGQQGVREHEDHVALYYATRRNADGLFNAKTGRYDGISTAYRMKLVPVFVVDPDKPMGIPSRESDQGRRRSFDATSAAMIKAVNTLVPQPIPPGSGEAQAGRPGGIPIQRIRDEGFRRNRPATDNGEGKPAEPDPR
jgi:hypothetical protein